MKVPDILFVSHLQQQCGVYQFGRNIAEALRQSAAYRFHYRECADAEEFLGVMAELVPAAVIYNYYPSTMPWLNRGLLGKLRPIPHLGILHEVTQTIADQADNALFDYHIAPDPTLLLNNPIVFKTGRLLPAYTNRSPVPEIPTIGCFGFATEGKGFDRVIGCVQAEYDQAVIRLHLPSAAFGDADGQHAAAIARHCRDLVTKPGIALSVSHDFLTPTQLLDFLAANTVNAFFYDKTDGRGISSAIDNALAVRRPLAISRSNMFRHLFGARPSVCIDDSSLRQIVANGIEPLRPFFEEWTVANLVWEYDRIVTRALSKTLALRADGSREGLLRRAVRKLKRYLGYGMAPAIPAAPAAPVGDKRMGLGQVSATVAPAPTALLSSAEAYKADTVSVGPFNRILDDSARAQYAPAVAALFRLAPDLMARKIDRANIQQAFVLDTVLKFAARHNSPKILCVGGYEDSAAESLRALGFRFEDIDPTVNYDLDTFLTKPSTVLASYDIVFSTSVIEHVENDTQFVRQIASLLAPDGVAILTCDFKDDYRPGDPTPAEDFRFYTQRDLRERLLRPLADCVLIDEPRWDCPSPDFTYAGFHYTFASLVFRKASL